MDTPQAPINTAVAPAGPDRTQAPDHLRVEAWTDPVVDRVGHDPRSTYVERFWLGVLGPSCTCARTGFRTAGHHPSH